MSISPGKQAQIPTSSQQSRGNGHIPATRFVARKMPQPERFTEGHRNGTSDSLDDVIFLRLPEVKAVTGLSKTTLYTLIQDKSFPAPVRLGPRAVAWVKSEVRQWAQERVQASRSAA
jgi:prophage regulatory protein